MTKYSYNNHLNKRNKSFIKYSVAHTLLPLVKVLNRKYFDKLNIKLLFSPNFYIVRCNSCGYGVFDKQIDLEILERYYNTLYWQSEGIPSSTWHQKNLYLEDARAFGQYCCVQNWVEQFTELNMLEIGAGSAFFSRLLKENHSGEVHLNVIEAGRGWESYYSEIGIKLTARFFPFESNKKFHYIHTSHWFEHVPNVHEALIKIKSLLSENGLFFIEVPNCNAEYYSLDFGDLPHIHFFTKESLCALLEKNGFKTLTIGEYGLTFEEEFKRRFDPSNFDEKLAEEEDTSLRGNISRKGGSCLRALFQLVGKIV